MITPEVIIALIGLGGAAIGLLKVQSQRAVDRERAKADIAVRKAQDESKKIESDAQRRYAEQQASVQQINNGYEIMRGLLNEVHEMNRQHSSSQQQFHGFMAQQVDTTREMVDTLKMQNTWIAGIQTDLGEARLAMEQSFKALPDAVDVKFNPVVIAMNTVILRLDTLIARVADWDARIGLFIQSSNTRLSGIETRLSVLSLISPVPSPKDHPTQEDIDL